MKNFIIHNLTLSIHHSKRWASPPSYEVRCNTFTNSNVGIRIESNSVVDDFGGSYTVSDPVKPAANNWVNMANKVGIDIHQSSQFSVGEYFKATDETDLPVQNNLIIITTGNLNKFNSCK